MSAQEAMARYEIDPAISRLTIRAFAGGLLSVMGHNPTIVARDWSGQAAFVPGTLDQATVRVTALAESFEVTDDVSEKDKREIEGTMKREVLEISRYPQIVFESSSISSTKTADGMYAVNITGNLTLHGVQCPRTIECQVTVTGGMLRSFGEFSVRQTDYGIKLVSVAGGALKLKDEIKCSFEILARKQE